MVKRAVAMAQRQCILYRAVQVIARQLDGLGQAVAERKIASDGGG